jgi:guanine deaminase
VTQPRYLIIRGGLVVDARSRSAQPADILVAGDTIAEVGPPGSAAPDDATVFDAADRAIIPGLVNAHVHGHGTMAKGLVGDRQPLEGYLTTLPGLAGHRTLEDKRLNGLLGAAEMIRKGCTACYDLFFEFPTPSLEGLTALGRAYEEAGVRAVIAPMMADTTIYNAYPGLIDAFPEPLQGEVRKLAFAPWQETAAAAERIFSDWPFDRTQIKPAIAPTIPLHCSDDFLRRCGELARAYDLPLQTHLAESRTQAVVGLRRYGETLTAHIERLGLLGPQMSAAHGIWLSGEDMRRLADGGASVVHAPMSNMRVGSGLARVRQLLDRGVNVGLATDGTNTSDSLNMFEATRLASFISRVQTDDYRRWLGVDEVMTMATEGSARAMGFGGKIGRIAAGWKADLVFLDLGHLHYVPLHDVLSQIVFAENGAAVDSVMIGGRLVLERGRLTTIDEVRLRHDVEAAAARLAQANAPARQLSAQLWDIAGRFCRGLVQGQPDPRPD